MPGITRANADSAGPGLINFTPQAFFTVEGFDVAIVGATVAPHGGGPHAVASFALGSDFLSVNGIPVVIQGKAATCGHTATGSSLVQVSN